MTHDAHSDALTPNRLEAFSDGVLAVIITIMVLELKVPHANGAAGVRDVLPILFVYILSFTFTGIYWVNHHMLVSRLKQVDARILYSNLLFLFCASLLPYFTSWVLAKERDRFSVMLYTLSLLATGFTFMLLRLAIERRLRLEGTRTMVEVATQRKHWLSLGLYLVGMIVARYHATIAILIDAGVTLLWILPDLGMRHGRLDPHQLALAPRDHGAHSTHPSGHP